MKRNVSKVIIDEAGLAGSCISIKSVLVRLIKR